MQHILHFVIALMICWSGYVLFYPKHNIIMILSIILSFLILDKLKSYLNKDDDKSKKKMQITVFCLIGSSISALFFIPEVIHKPFLLALGSPIGIMFSLPVIWGLFKKAKHLEFYLNRWTIDWAAIHIIVFGTLLSILNAICIVLLIVAIEMQIQSLIKITEIFLGACLETHKAAHQQ